MSNRNRDYQREIKPRVSYKSKSKNDFERVKDMVDVYDMYFPPQNAGNKIKKAKINLNLLNGRADTKMYAGQSCFNVGKEKIDFEKEYMIHHPITSQVASSLFGLMHTRPYKPAAKHHGSGVLTTKKAKYNQLIKQAHQNKIINPLREKIFQQYLLETGVQDIRQLQPKDLQQLQFDVNKRVEAELPKDVLEFVLNDFETPTQKTAQTLLKYFTDKLDTHQKYIDSFNFSIAMAEMAIMVDDAHGLPTYEILNPAFLTYGGGHSDNVWIQHKDWVRYEKWGSYQYITQRWAEELTNSDYKDLEECLSPLRVGGGKWGKHDEYSQMLIREHHDPNSFIHSEYPDVNHKTKDGQRKLKEIYSRIVGKYGDKHGSAYSNYGIREAKFTYRDKRELKVVTRNEGGFEKKYYLDEHYEPTHLDLDVTDIWVDEIYQATKLGTGTFAKYVGVRALPGQYTSINNPWGVELNVYGREFYTHMNTVDNVSHVDLAKADQMEYDIIMHNLRKDMDQDLGSVMVMLTDYKPSNLSWKEWFSLLKKGKVALLEPNKRGAFGVDPQFLKNINLSKASDISTKLSLLQNARNNIITNMHSSNTMVSGASPYATNENIRATQQSTFAQTESLFDIHTQIHEKAINGLMRRVKYLYYSGDLAVDVLLEEAGLTDMKLNEGLSWEHLKIDFKLDRLSQEALQKQKSEALTLLQNQFSPLAVWEILKADTTDEVDNIFKKENKRVEEMQAQAQQAAQQAAQQEQQAEEAKSIREHQQKLEIERLKGELKLLGIELDSDKFRKAADVDGNNVADKLQIELLKLQQQLAIHREKMALEEKKLISNVKG